MAKVAVGILVQGGCIAEVHIFGSSTEALLWRNKVLDNYGCTDTDELSESTDDDLYVDCEVEVE